jgi:hypothetical protein
MIRTEPWAEELLKRWAEDAHSPLQVRNAISGLGRKA